jgi:Tol biopolymer transport system component
MVSAWRTLPSPRSPCLSLQRFGEPPNLPPTNIWLWSLASGQATRIAQQPVNASFGTGLPNETFIRRGTPVWSPDGLRLSLDRERGRGSIRLRTRW